jgi:hypothetical protein
METQRFYHPEDPNQPGSQRPRPGRLGDIRSRGSHYSESSRNALDKIHSQGNLQGQLQNLESESGQ